MTDFLTSDGVKIKYTSKGSGRTIIFMHGWSGYGKDFGLVARRLSWSFRTVFYDIRGHGMSGHNEDMSMERQAQDLRELIDYLEVDDFVLVGYSLGGLIMLEYLRGDNPRPKGIVFADTSPSIGEDIFTKEAYDDHLALMKDDFYKAYREFLVKMLPDEEGEDIDKLLDIRRKTLEQNYTPALIKLWQDMHSRDYWDDLEGLNLPSLVMRGEYSFHPREVFERIQELTGANEYIEVEDATHQFVIEEPVFFGEELTLFAQSLD